MDRAPLVTALAATDPATRAAAVADVGPEAVRDPQVLSALIGATRDDRPAPAALQPAAPEDPFASFFGEATARRERTIGELAGDALSEHLRLGDAATVEALAAALADDPAPPLVDAVAALVGRVRWDDEAAAVRALVPPVLRADHSLYEALPGLGDAGLRAVVDVALRPLHARAVNEVLNHPSAGRTCAAAMREAVEAGLELTEREAMELLALLVAWAGPEALAAARVLEERWEWVVAFAAFDDPDAAARLRAWLATEPDAPDALGEVVIRAACSRRPVDGYPLAEFLAWCDGDCRAITTWRVVAPCADLLRTWVTRWGQGDGPSERAWDAIALLVDAGLHGPVIPVIADAVAGRDPSRALPDDVSLFKLLGRAEPPVPGVVPALLSRALDAPERLRDVLQAVVDAATDDDLPELRAFADAFLSRAEAAPERRYPPRRGVVRIVRDGVDVPAVEPLVERLGDPALSERLAGVLPRFEHA